MQELIYKRKLLNTLCKECGHCKNMEEAEQGSAKPCSVHRIISEQPTIEAEPVRYGKGCSYCKGRSYSKKPLTVITRTMKRVEIVFEYCPACGRKMDGGADNG